MFAAVNGMRRTRLPVAAKIALATAGPISAVAGSPMPPGFSVLLHEHDVDLRRLVHAHHR